MSWLFKKILIGGIFVLSISSRTLSQDYKPGKFLFDGYLKFLQTVAYDEFKKDWLVDNLIHNRFNLRYYPSDNWKIIGGIRNRFFYGDFVKTIPDYAELITDDPGFFDLSINWIEGNSFIFNTTIDRLYINYLSGNFEATVGRQRINWGKNLIWNPNDLFNAYSYFDFDYEERPGSEAVRMKYYTGFTSHGELVYQLADSIEAMAFSGLYEFNKWQYDIQVLGGYVRNDWVLGSGWSGNIGGGAFRGEVSYFYKNTDTITNRHQVVFSLSGDYTFKNQLYAQLSLIFNSLGDTEDIRFNEELLLGGTTAQNLTPSRAEIFGQASYPVTPLFTTNFAAIVNPFDGSLFFGPGFTFSLKDNLELLLFGQFFLGKEDTQYGDLPNLLYWRFRWSY
jgi:hypothetical protein